MPKRTLHDLHDVLIQDDNAFYAQHMFSKEHAFNVSMAKDLDFVQGLSARLFVLSVGNLHFELMSIASNLHEGVGKLIVEFVF